MTTKPKRKSIKHLHVEKAMTLGRLFDRLSDKAFKAGRIEEGTRWGNKAMEQYTKAETLELHR